MGVVYRARDLHLDKIVALKTLFSEDEAGQRGIQQFLKGGLAHAAVDHQNVVKIYELNKDEFGPYIIMDFVDGPSLSEYIGFEGALPLEKAMDIFLPVVRAVNHAHRQSPKVLHRDIKPANILLTRDLSGEKLWIPKLTDFGLSRVGGYSGLTMTGQGGGTQGYMAPEQELSLKDADERADVYSLGKTLQEMLTGKSPFETDTGHVPVRARTIVERCTRTRPEDRYFNVKELIKDLEKSLMGEVKRVDMLPEGTCPVCEFKNSTDANYCTGCGGGLRKKCPNIECNKQIYVMAPFCPYCGLDINKEEKINGLVVSLKAALEEKNYEEAINRSDMILKLENNHVEANRLKEKAQNSITNVKVLKDKITAAKEQSDFESERRCIEQCLAIVPHDKGLISRIEEIDQEINVRDAEKAVDQGNLAMEAFDLDTARKHYEKALALNPEMDEAKQGLSKLEQNEIKYKDLQDKLKSAVEANRYKEVISIAESIFELNADDKIAKKSHQGATDYFNRLHELNENIRTARSSGDMVAEEKSLLEVLELTPEDEDLKKRIQEVQEKLSAQRVSEAIERAQFSYENGYYVQAKNVLTSALEYVSENVILNNELIKVEKKIDELSQVIEQLRELVEESMNLLNNRQYEDALCKGKQALRVSDYCAAEDSWTGSKEDEEPLSVIQHWRKRSLSVVSESNNKINQIDVLWRSFEKYTEKQKYKKAIYCLKKLLNIDLKIVHIRKEIIRISILRRARIKRKIYQSVSVLILLIITWIVYVGINIFQTRTLSDEIVQAFNDKDYESVDEMIIEHQRLRSYPLIIDSFTKGKRVDELKEKNQLVLDDLRKRKIEADRCFKEQQYDNAIVVYNGMIEICPSYENGYHKVRKEAAKNILSKIRRLLDSAENMKRKKLYEDAYNEANKVLEIQQENKEAIAIKNYCQNKLFLYNEEMTKGRDAQNVTYFLKAKEHYNNAKEIYPNGNFTEIDAYLKTTANRIDSLLYDARDLMKKQDYEQAKKKTMTLLSTYDVQNDQAKSIHDESARILEKISYNLRNANSLMTKAMPEDALSYVDGVLDLQNDNEEANSLKKRLVEVIEDVKKYIRQAEETIDQARSSSDTSKYAIALESAQKAIALDKMNRKAMILINQARIFVPPKGCVTVFGATFPMGIEKTRIDEYKELFEELDDEAWFEDEMPAFWASMSPFWIGREEVTCAQFCDYLNEQQPREGNDFSKHPQINYQLDQKAITKFYSPKSGQEHRPITRITWYNASAYCEWYGHRLQNEMNLNDQVKCHLPTEAQWEFAASFDPIAKKKEFLPWGKDRNVGIKILNENTSIQDVGSVTYDRSPCGACDMAGNVSEWSQDWYDEKYYKDMAMENNSENPKQDPKGSNSYQAKVIKGGYWSKAQQLGKFRLTGKMYLNPKEARDTIGFRVVVEIPKYERD